MTEVIAVRVQFETLNETCPLTDALKSLPDPGPRQPPISGAAHFFAMDYLIARFLNQTLERVYWTGVREGAGLAAIVLLVIWILIQRREKL